MNGGLLVVSFGTSFPETRRKNLDAAERALGESFPDRRVFRAYTSGMVIAHIARDEGVQIPTVKEALEEIHRLGIRDLAVQPTHFMPGEEYEKLAGIVSGQAARFDRLVMGKPLVYSRKDEVRLAKILLEEAAPYLCEGKLVCLMGHGTQSPANGVYTRLQDTILSLGYPDIRIATVEAKPGVEELMEYAEKSGKKQAVLLPLMMVAGDHASKDMAGSQPDSWASRFRQRGVEVQCVLRGLCENPEVRQMLCDHLLSAMNQHSSDFIG